MILKRFLLSFALFFYGSVLMAAEAERELARSLAVLQKDWIHALQGNTPLVALTQQVPTLRTSTFQATLMQANTEVTSALGHYRVHKNWYQVRLAYAPRETTQDAILVTYFHDQNQDGSVEAFDEHGQSVWLDLTTPPEQRVIMLEPTERFYEAGKQILNKQAQVVTPYAYQAQSQLAPEANAPDITFVQEKLHASILKSVQIKDFDQPWLLGKSRVFAVVTGVNFSNQEPYSEVIEMPYLTKKGKVYLPGQYLIFWNKIKYGVANVSFFQHTSLKDFRALALIIDGVFAQVPSWSKNIDLTIKVLRIGMQIVNALPPQWFKGKSRFLDIFYGLEAQTEYTSHFGTNENVQINIKNKEVIVQYQNDGTLVPLVPVPVSPSTSLHTGAQ